jgi:hypothetical protein
LVEIAKVIKCFRGGKEGIYATTDSMARPDTFAEEPFVEDEICTLPHGDDKLFMERR